MRRMRFISILVVLLISFGLVTVTLAAFGSINNFEESRLAIGTRQKGEIAFDNIIMRTMSIEDGLVAHYPFNNHANDESGNGNDGTVVGAVLTTDRFGKADSAFSFDGDDYVEIPDDSSFDFNDKGFSLAFWIKTEATTGGQSDRDDIVGKGDATIEGFTISMRYNYPTFFIGDHLECGGATKLNDGKWHHLGGTRDDANNVILYVDGKMESMCKNNENVNTNYSMFVGKHGTMNDSYYDGVIDDIYIYNRALSADEVEMLYYYGTDKVKIQKEVNNPSPGPGQTVKFTIQVTNYQTETITSGLISDTLSADLSFTGPISLEPPSSGTVGSSPPILVSDLIVAPQSQVTVTFPARVSNSVVEGTEIINTAWFTSSNIVEPLVGSVKLTTGKSKLYIPCTYKNYCPDFFDDFSNPASGWQLVDDEYERTEYLNGEYRVQPKQIEYVYYYTAPTCSRENYEVEVDARWAGTPGGSYGVFFGADYVYDFEMDPIWQEFSVWRLDTSGWTEVVPWTYSSAIKVGTSSNHLKFTRQGTQFTLSVNGVVLGTWSHDGLIGLTEVGVMTYLYYKQPTYDVRFDNFSVNSLPGGSTSSLQTNKAGSMLFENNFFRERLVNLNR